MSKSKHEALRRDIEDYKLLLVKYQSLRIEQEIISADLERQSKILDNRNEKYLDALKHIDYLEKELNYIRNEIESCKLSQSDKEKAYNDLKRMYYKEKGKNVRMQKGQAELYIWKASAIFFFFAMLLVGSQN